MASDSRTAEFLEWAQTDVPGLFLLGSLNRHITVHSQQRRAVNLVHSLSKTGSGLDGKSMAVVGAGFAGLTAAAYALEETTASVTLIDAAARPLWLQDNCANRWLHPGIYDWPAGDALEPRTSLPLLNWRADTAKNVARQVRAEWERIEAREDRLEVILDKRVMAIARNGARLRVDFDNRGPEQFDIVVLAVGFGLERGGPADVGYWNDIDGLDSIRFDVNPKPSVLISGFGDGGLADVLRLCLPQFRQDSLVELVRDVPANVCDRLLEWERTYIGNEAKLDQLYDQLAVDQIIGRMKNASPLAHVTLTGRGHLYGQRSAVLNRFLVSQLRKARRDDAFKLIAAPVRPASLSVLDDGRSSIEIEGESSPRMFDHIVFRHGPQAALSQIAPLDSWPSKERLRRHWYDLPQSLDKTRQPLWRDEDGAHGAAPVLPDFRAYESSSRPWCLILQPKPPKRSKESPNDWYPHVRSVLAKIAEARDLNQFPLLLDSQQALAGKQALADTVRMLCVADIVIADVTKFDQGVLFLLGVRAAVRRGVTISCTHSRLDALFWKSVPFNLKELKLVSFADSKTGTDDLAVAIADGLTQSVDSDRYLDLPVYDYVRQEPPTDAISDPPPALFLRPFNEDARARLLERLLGQALKEVKKWKSAPKIEAVIDQSSPRLTGQRLYEAIRHWQTCVADLTYWRANVLFELGVRLAVQDNETICLIDPSAEGEKTFSGIRGVLGNLLKPYSYNQSSDNLADAVRQPTDTHIYHAALRHFRTKQDHPSRQVDERLDDEAPMKSRDNPQQQVDPRQLFARDNRDYSNELSQTSIEIRCAAWYYLVEREQPHLMRRVDLLDPQRADVFRRFQGLGSRLKIELGNKPRDQKVRDSIETCMEAAARVADLADLIEAWSFVRAAAPWNVDLSAMSDAETAAFKRTWKRRRSPLLDLQRELKDLGNPVCELPLQGLRSHLRRLDVVLRRINGGPA
jgi:hypothetical protein